MTLPEVPLRTAQSADHLFIFGNMATANDELAAAKKAYVQAGGGRLHLPFVQLFLHKVVASLCCCVGCSIRSAVRATTCSRQATLLPPLRRTRRPSPYSPPMQSCIPIAGMCMYACADKPGGSAGRASSHGRRTVLLLFLFFSLPNSFPEALTRVLTPPPPTFMWACGYP